MNDPMGTVVFSCDRPTVLNAIYDVIDSLGLITEHINSERGVLLLRTSDQIAIRIMVDTVFPSKQTKVGIAALQECGCDWVHVIFDELESMLINELRMKEEAK
ncbi:MAG: hypothetical protein PHO41_04790 [Eubacteriales bacterium]|nr:hypothetical protein [Eubacteriales bacterium]